MLLSAVDEEELRVDSQEADQELGLDEDHEIGARTIEQNGQTFRPLRRLFRSFAALS